MRLNMRLNAICATLIFIAKIIQNVLEYIKIAIKTKLFSSQINNLFKNTLDLILSTDKIVFQLF